jgi:putative ATPase
VISALLSRCQVYVLNPLGKKELESLLQNAVKNDVHLKKREIVIKESEELIRLSGGDARKLLNAFELLINTTPDENQAIVITNKLVSEHVQNRSIRYDKTGEQHSDIVSAFIKSIRGSDPNAAVYYLARMLEGGEDVKFIARRLIISASEDIGNANPTALVVANNTFQAVSVVGPPESRIILSQCTIYLACSVKSNASYKAINKAQNVVRETGDLEIPLHIRNAPTALMKELGYGEQYKYAHDYEFNFVPQEYLPSEISGTKFFEPGNNQREQAQYQQLKKLWKDKYGY